MTNRDCLNKQMRKQRTISILILVLWISAIGIVIGLKLDPVKTSYILLPAFGVAATAIIYGLFWGAIACPKCHKNLTFTIMICPTAGWLAKVPKSVKYCPGCGVDLDEKFNSENNKV